ncbi:MAG TPA: hypothetical protein VM925_17645 [Labilithrix sp.]|nr:hypothetical protein [Labilithrix sp.]
MRITACKLRSFRRTVAMELRSFRVVLERAWYSQAASSREVSGLFLPDRYECAAPIRSERLRRPHAAGRASAELLV